MDKINRDINQLTKEQIIMLASAFTEDTFEIVTTVPSSDNIPLNLSETLQNKENFAVLMEDENANFNYFSIKYPIGKSQSAIMPFGVYGVSDKRNIRFPLVINGIWVSLFMLDEATFGAGLQICDASELSKYYSRFTSWKQQLISKVFNYYYLSEYNSIMSWPKRGERSFTRQLAEEIGFLWQDFNNNELFSSLSLSTSEIDYVKNSLFRWKVLGENDPNPRPPITPQIIQLITSIIGFPLMADHSNI
ncbi:hypothetical protein [Aquimarina intermedia]|uniref:Uncharacterized protein n=1 Tax=Aquimarina intermedia TaxID=350814 RepID=A0A5S5C7B0_9FLAO|nr:hypothetical protein [Aquimarina intermedia]TYP74362.1 hypothetical protein BD809_104182 [Aquimarina intermedia]